MSSKASAACTAQQTYDAVYSKFVLGTESSRGAGALRETGIPGGRGQRVEAPGVPGDREELCGRMGKKSYQKTTLSYKL